MKPFRIAATLALLAALGLTTGHVRASEEVTPQQCHPWPDCEPDPPIIYASQFVSQTVPATMTAGQVYAVTVKMKNVGDTNWSGTLPFLGSQNPDANLTWGLNKVPLPGTVGPQQTATFNFNVTAPMTPGNYNFQWQMDRGTPFGAMSTNVAVTVNPPPVDNASFVSQSIPVAMTTGQAYPINIKLKNTGNTTWTSGNNYKLALLTPAGYAAWGIGNRFNLAASVGPGGTATFTASITPSAAGGASFQFRMIKGATLFGASTPAVAVTAQNPPPPPPPPLLGVRTTYDALGRVRKVEQDSELGVLTTATSYLNNVDGPYTLVTNPRGFQTRTWYQAYDQPSQDLPVEIWHPEATRTVIDRDVFGKPKTLTRRNDAGTVSLTRSYTYNANQELCRTVEPETGATLLGFDAAGNLKWSSAGLAAATACEPAGTSPAVAARRVDRTYDTRNRLKTLAFPDGLGNQEWTYTPDGLTQSIVTDNGGGQLVTNTYAYNRRRLMTDEDLTLAGVFNWPIDYGYNGNGHLSLQNWHGVSINFAPNALGQPTQAGTYATGVSYFPNGAMKQFTYGNGMVHTLSQNTRGLPDVSCDFYGTCTGAAALRDVYDYDQNGNVLAILDGRANAPSDREMSYDGLDRLTHVVSPMYGAEGANYAYDALDNLIRVRIGGPAARDRWYCYDAKNQLTNLKTVSCAGTSVMGLGYDLQGNLNNRNGVVHTFDYGNRLRSVGTSPVSKYAYDGHGRRVWDFTSNDKYSHYNQAGQLTLTGDERVGKVAEYIHLNGSLVAIRERDVPTATYTTKYQHTDALGSPVAVTNAARTVIEKSEYEPYGKEISHPAKDGPGYTGHVLDAATGMLYMQQRYCDPTIGRCLSVDPVTAYSNGDMRFFNRYAYAFNSPYTFKDPDGREGELFWTAPDKATVTFRYTMSGVSPSFSAEQLNAQVAKNYSGTVSVNGVDVAVTAQAIKVDAAGKGVNSINVVNDTAGVTKSGRSETNAIGGNKITLGATGVNAASAATGSHEVGHALGGGDQYKGGLGANNKVLSSDVAGPANIMKTLQGAPNANSQTLGEIINAKTNVNKCAQGVKAASGGC